MPPTPQRGRREPLIVSRRIQAAKASGLLRVFEEMERNPRGVIIGTRCRLCNGILAELIPSDEHREVRVINGQRTVFERLVMAITNIYRLIEIMFDDGSKHITTVCRPCLRRVNNVVLEALYSSDMETSAAGEAAGRGAILWDFWKDRIPISHREIN